MLKKYYEDLANKTSFINEVCYKTGRSSATIRNWIKYGMKPADSKDVDILAEITGIEKSKLWNEEN